MDKMICPHCNSNNLKKAGHGKTGKQRYFCKDCKRNFTENTDYKVKSPIVCSFCGSMHTVRSGKSKEGRQRYICRECGKKGTVGGKGTSAGSLTDNEKRTILIYHNMGVTIRDLAKHLGRTEKTVSIFLQRNPKLVIQKKGK